MSFRCLFRLNFEDEGANSSTTETEVITHPNLGKKNNVWMITLRCNIIYQLLCSQLINENTYMHILFQRQSWKIGAREIFAQWLILRMIDVSYRFSQ